MKKAYGFTIVELIVVIVIIGILVSISVVTYNTVTNKSKQTQVVSALKDISSSLASDYLVNETYPVDLDGIINVPGGVSVNSDINPQYSFDSSNNTYCLTIFFSGSEPAAHFLTNEDTTPRPGACPGHRMSGNFVDNGFGEKGDNSGFPSFTFNSSDFPPGASGSLVSTTGSYVFYCSSQKIPIDQNKTYKISGWARQTVAAVTTARIYFGLCPYDADGFGILPQNYLFRPGTTTTLAQPLKNGDTVVYLNSVANWYDVNDANTHYRSFIFWGYTDGKGKTWSPETYSRNTWITNMWDGGASKINTTNKTITLNKAWNGGNYAAGHPVSNGSSGSTYMYSAASNALLDQTWTKYTSGGVTGTVTGLTSAGNAWPKAATSASVMLGINSGSPPATSRPAYGGIDFYQVP